MSRLTGDWKSVNKMLKDLKELPEQLNTIFKKKVVEQVELVVKQDLEQQNLRLAPLSPEYARSKKTDKILIETREYINRLRVFDIKEERGKMTVYVGASDKDKHSSGMSVGELARLINYGTRKQPARPHFKLTWEKNHYKIRQSAKRELNKEINKMFRK